MKNQDQALTSKYRDITIADVKASKGYETISDELAQQIIDTMKTYTEIIYSSFKECKLEQQSGKVVLMKTSNKKKAA